MSSQITYGAEPAKGWRPWAALVPFLGIAFVAATVISLTAALQSAHFVDAQENPIGLSGFVVFLLLPFGALSIVVVAWIRFVERRPLASIGLGGAHRLQTFLGGQLAGVAMVTAIVAGIWIAGGFDMLALGGALGSPGAIGSIAVLLACFAVQSGIEEFFFRGWMLSAIAAKFGVVIAVVLSSLVFTFLHFDPRGSWIFVANVFLFAAFACCWAIRTGNVWVSWVGTAHGIGFLPSGSACESQLSTRTCRLCSFNSLLSAPII